MPPDGRGSQAEPGGQAGGGDRAVLQDQPGDAPARPRLRPARRVLDLTSAQLGTSSAQGVIGRSHVFHNIIVP